MKQLILLEGPDFAGKTTLAKSLMNKWPDMRYFKAIADTTEKDYCDEILSCTENTLLMDRCWLSEAVYGPILRKETFNYDEWLKCHKAICEVIRKQAVNVLILYAPITSAEMHYRFNKRGDAYLEQHAKRLQLLISDLLYMITQGYKGLFDKHTEWNVENWPILSVGFIN